MLLTQLAKTKDCTGCGNISLFVRNLFWEVNDLLMTGFVLHNWLENSLCIPPLPLPQAVSFPQKKAEADASFRERNHAIIVPVCHLQPWSLFLSSHRSRLSHDLHTRVTNNNNTLHTHYAPCLATAVIVASRSVYLRTWIAWCECIQAHEGAISA